MSANGRNTTPDWIDPDDAPEWPDEAWDRAQLSIGGNVIKPASGTLTRRGRPPVGPEAKRQVTLRLPAAVLDHFKSGGAGWQTRIGEVLERHVARRPGRSVVADKKSEYALDAAKKGKRATRP